MTGRRYAVALPVLACLAPLAVFAAAGTGAYPIAPWRIPAILWAQAEADGYAVLLYIRFPRVVLAALVGAALGLTGAVLQGLFRNPMADPGLIGVTAGAALGASVWIVFAGSIGLAMWGLPAAAFASGLLVVWLVWRLAQSNGRVHTATLLLTGIALNAIAGAGIGLLIYLSNDEQLRGIAFWQLGGLQNATWSLNLVTAPALLAGVALLLPLGRGLNALSLGEAEAYHLGVPVRALHRRALCGAALSVGAAVAAAGGIGFIGLVAPHLLRLGCGADNRRLLPASALLGAFMLVAADTAARTVVQPAEMPVGILTALVGGPFFLWLLMRYKREVFHA